MKTSVQCCQQASLTLCTADMIWGFTTKTRNTTRIHMPFALAHRLTADERRVNRLSRRCVVSDRRPPRRLPPLDAGRWRPRGWRVVLAVLAAAAAGGRRRRQVEGGAARLYLYAQLGKPLRVEGTTGRGGQHDVGVFEQVVWALQ